MIILSTSSLFTYGFMLNSCTLTFTEFFNDVRGGEIPNFRVRMYARTWICQALIHTSQCTLLATLPCLILYCFITIIIIIVIVIIIIITISENIWNNFMNLKEQNCIIKHVTNNCSSKIINTWQSMLNKLPGSIFAFARKALIFCLPNRSNLFRWKMVENNECGFCKRAETQLHVLSNCVPNLNRYTWRHDSILWTILKKISSSVEDEVQIYADCCEVQYKCSSELFLSKRPDIVVIKSRKVWVVELTVCFETNTKKSRDYKQTRYENLKRELQIECDDFEVIYFEVTTLGFISKDSYKQMSKFLSECKTNVDRVIYKCMETSIRASFFVFCGRNKEWTDPELLKFY